MGTVTPFPLTTGRPSQIGFERVEQNRILEQYVSMVAAGQLKE